MNYKEHNTRKLRREAVAEAILGQVQESSSLKPATYSTKENTARADSEGGFNSTTNFLEIAQSLCAGSIRLHAIDTPYFEATDCYVIYESLWNSFCEGYCATQEYWPRGMTQLATGNYVLDLALIALSAKRLSFDGYPKLRLLSYEAYGKSLILFRDQMSKNRGERGALLAVVSLVFALFEACSLQLDHLFSGGNGSFKHLLGAMTLMDECGPQAFSIPGYHDILQKIREKGVNKFSSPIRFNC